MLPTNKRSRSSLDDELDAESTPDEVAKLPRDRRPLGPAFRDTKKQLVRYGKGGAPIDHNDRSDITAPEADDDDDAADTPGMFMGDSDGDEASSTAVKQDIPQANRTRHTAESHNALQQTVESTRTLIPVLPRGHFDHSTGQLHTVVDEPQMNDDEDNDDPDDLFASTFGKQADCRSCSVVSSDNDDPNSDEVHRSKPQATHSKTPSKPISKPTETTTPNHIRRAETFDPSEHSSHCAPSARSPSTPPYPTARGKEPGIQISPVLSSVHKLHCKAIHLIPRLPLGPHRYWVGIVHVTKDVRSMRSDRDLLWLKANRTTTVRTLVHVYAMQAARAPAAIQLRLGGVGAVAADESLSALDLLGVRKVFFWAVEVVVRDAGAEASSTPSLPLLLAPVSRHAAREPWGVTKGLVPVRSLGEDDVIDLESYGL